MATENKTKTIVSSWNEWDPLKHVIVGRADGTVVQAPEPACVRDWPKYGFPKGTYGPLPKEMEDKGQRSNWITLPNCWRAEALGSTGRPRSILPRRCRRRTGCRIRCSGSCRLVIFWQPWATKSWKRPCPSAAAGSSSSATVRCSTDTSRKTRISALKLLPSRG